MKLVYNIAVVALVLGLMNPLHAKREEYTKVIEETFAISSEGTTHLYNKYGSMEVKTWDRNEVALKVTIVVKANSESKAEDTFDRIHIDISNSSDYVRAVTEIESKSNLVSWTKGDYKIHYEVSMPASNRLEAGMKYGNMHVEQLSGVAEVEVKYGNLQLDGVGDKSELTVGYGNGTVQKAEDLAAYVSYGKLTINEARDIDITSKYARVIIEEAREVRSESKYDTYDIDNVEDFRNTGKYDNFRIDEADNVRMTSKYTHVKIEELNESADIEFSYGGATIEEVQSDFSGVNLHGNYAIFKVGVDAAANYNLETSGNYAGLSDLSFLKLNQNVKGDHSFDVKGFKGSSSAKSQIKAKLNYGSIKIWEN